MKKELPNEAGRMQRVALKELFNFEVDLENQKVEVKNEEEEVIVFDVETSGLDDKVDKIVQISAIKFICKDGKFTEKERFDTFINQPEYDENKVIPDEKFKAENGRDKTFLDLTGISNELLSHYPTEDELFPKIYEFFGDEPIICGHNVPFDFGFITEMYIRHGKNFLTKPERRLDTLPLARDLIPKADAPKTIGKSGKERATYTLGALAQMYGIDKEEGDETKQIGFHNSMNDVIVTSRLLQVLIYEFAQRELREGEKNKAEENIEKERAIVKSITFWEGYRGFSRIYVNAILRGTTVGYYYDIRKKIWGERDEGTMVATDMELLISDALELANVKDEYEFGKIRTEIKADEKFLERYKTK